MLLSSDKRLSNLPWKTCTQNIQTSNISELYHNSVTCALGVTFTIRDKEGHQTSKRVVVHLPDQNQREKKGCFRPFSDL